MVSLETLMDAVLEEVSSGERKAEKPDQDASAEMQETEKSLCKEDGGHGEKGCGTG